MAAAPAASAYKPGDLSRLLAPSAGAPVLASQVLAADPSFFGYLRPTKGRPPSRKAAKGGGKFSEANLNKKAKAKKEEAKKQQERHHKEVAEAAARKKAAKEARSASGRPKAAAAAAAPSNDGEDEDSGVDESEGDEADDVDEAAIESFMKDIEADGADEEEDGDASSADGDKEQVDEDPEAKAKRERLAKRDKRLAEDREMEAPPTKKKDIHKQRAVNRETDPRLPRTIFVGNVPTSLKTAKLSKWVETQLGVDSGVQASIIESVRYRSVAVADPKLPRKVAIQKGLLHEARDSLNAYVVFVEQGGQEWVSKALQQLQGKDIELDGKKWRVRVDRVTSSSSEGAEQSAADSHAHSVFVGNLPFSVNENDLYAHFASCGPALLDVRVVRDRASNLGKGIAFLRFDSAEGVRHALAFHNTAFKPANAGPGSEGRPIRVMRAVDNKKLHKTVSSDDLKNKKGKSASSSNKKGANSSSDKKGGASASGKEGYGGAHKIKEMNQAGVLKKPRHKPRDGSQPIQQVQVPAGVAAPTAGAGAAAAASAAGAAPAIKARVQGFKRTFEGEHADPSAHIKRQKVEDIKQRERKEKKRDAKKLSAPSAAAGSHKK